MGISLKTVKWPFPVLMVNIIVQKKNLFKRQKKISDAYCSWTIGNKELSTFSTKASLSQTLPP